MDDRIDRPRHPFMNFAMCPILAVVIAVLSGCATAGGSAGSPQPTYFEGLNLPDNFHWAKESGPPDSWAIMAFPPSGFVALREAEYRQFGSQTPQHPSESVIVGITPKSITVSLARQFWMMAELSKACPGVRADIRTTATEYLFEEKVPPCGAESQHDEVIRHLPGLWSSFLIRYSYNNKWMDPAQREQAVRLVSSFTIGYCQAPASNCPGLILGGGPWPWPHAANAQPENSIRHQN